MISATYIRQLPKAELHLHLEGSVDGVLLQTLSRKYNTEYRDLSPEQIAATLFRFEDFSGFLRTYRTICAHLREPEDYLLVLEALADYWRRENIRYVELITSPAILWQAGLDGEATLAALLDRSAELEKQGDVIIRWILDCVRQFGPESAQKTADLAFRYRDRGIVGIGLGGDETSVPMKEYEQVFHWAKANGLYIHTHAGEIGGPDQIWDALTLLGANRIGHGIQAARDPRLMEYLRNHAIALDVCLTSNVKTGAWAPISNHPITLLRKRGVPVTLNTDDPGIFETSLTEEYVKAVKYFSLRRDDLHVIVLQGISAAFLPASEKESLMQRFQDEIYRLAKTPDFIES
ncbi:MAG TPA: adenosine deaminase [Acidobacteriota bacterium]|nr:adenosine deaminase [Acidobacteriota bacterium]